MKRKEFIERMDHELLNLHCGDGDLYTCHAIPGGAVRDYKSFLCEVFPGFSVDNSAGIHFFRMDWLLLSNAEKKSIYQLRVALLAVFTAWALKTKAYKEW